MMNSMALVLSGCNIGFLGDVGSGEILVILLVTLVLFGGKGLPQMARTLGRISRNLQDASKEFKDQLLTADQPPSGEEPHPPQEDEASRGAAPPPDRSTRDTPKEEPRDHAG